MTEKELSDALAEMKDRLGAKPCGTQKQDTQDWGVLGDQINKILSDDVAKEKSPDNNQMYDIDLCESDDDEKTKDKSNKGKTKKDKPNQLNKTNQDMFNLTNK
jgi:hypothetical protein